MKATTKSAFHRGFTLIELMIVIVILGILMGTILPRLSGAQARARDTGRLADLNSIAQALELYFDDFGAYPNSTTIGAACLAPGGTNYDDTGANDFRNVFQTYFKSNTVPTPPVTGEGLNFGNTGADFCVDGYVYTPLASAGNDPGAYSLFANFEIPSKGNYIFDTNLAINANYVAYGAGTTLTQMLTGIDTPAQLVAAEAGDPDGSSTVYMLTN